MSDYYEKALVDSELRMCHLEGRQFWRYGCWNYDAYPHLIILRFCMNYSETPERRRGLSRKKQQLNSSSCNCRCLSPISSHRHITDIRSSHRHITDISRVLILKFESERCQQQRLSPNTLNDFDIRNLCLQIKEIYLLQKSQERHSGGLTIFEKQEPLHQKATIILMMELFLLRIL